MKMIINRGVPGSGKSTYAIQWEQADPENRVRVNRDDLRYQRFGAYHLTKPDGSIDKEKEGVITSLERQKIIEALKAGKDVMSDNTNLDMRIVKQNIKLAKQYGAEVRYKDFPITVEEAIRRDSLRDRQVGPDVIRKMFKKLGPNGEFHLFPGTYPTKPFVAPEQKKLAVGFDMDGSLDDTRTIVHLVEGKYRNFDAFHRSSLFTPPNPEVLQMAFDAHKAGLAVIITTARNEEYREVTQKWLDDLGVPYDNIFMRADGDNRPDFVVKDEMLNTQIRQHYDVVRFVDDNIQAVEAWRKNNIEVTVVPGHGEHIPLNQVIKIDNVFRRGGCIRCGKPLKSGALMGPKCAQIRTA